MVNVTIDKLTNGPGFRFRNRVCGRSGDRRAVTLPCWKDNGLCVETFLIRKHKENCVVKYYKSKLLRVLSRDRFLLNVA